MSIQNDTDSLSEHPLFRALILMGGSLALGCGGVAQSEGHAPENGGSSAAPATSTASAGSGNASNGSAGGPIQLGQAGGTSSGGSGSTSNAGIPTGDGCAYAQWDCSQLVPNCVRDLTLGMAGLGCSCNPARPLSANDCGPNESLFCQRAFGPFEPPADAWDYSVHIQCSCAPTPAATDYEAATDSCLQLFPGETSYSMGAYLPATMICDNAGVCTATSADVLRQEGIMCGCADISLK